MSAAGYSYDSLLVDIDGGVATLTINRPEVLNALNAATTRELGAAIDALAADDAVGAVIITGAGDRAFVAGADIGVLNTYGPVEARDAAYLGQSTFDQVEECSKPVIAAINGFALGGGCELAEKFAGKPPIALRYAIEAVNQGVNATMKEGQAIEAHLFGLRFATEDQSEGMSAFLEKRTAEWKGR